MRRQSLPELRGARAFRLGSRDACGGALQGGSVGSRLSLVTVVGALCVSTATVLAQPGPLPAADLAKQGIDLYKAGNFAGAVAPLERAVELEPNNFEYKYTLAQALRQSGQCAKAVPIYRSI